MSWPTNEEYLKRLLNIYWLRPETALTRFEDCIFVRDFCAHYLEGKNCIEMGCGNGLLSFIMAGGVIDYNYDVFLDVENPELYSTTTKDIFNKVSERKIAYDDTGLQFTYQYGVDWKEGLLSQAKRYRKLYKGMYQADLNQKIELKGKYDTIFCNMLYWLNEPEEVLKNWSELLNDKGRIILFLTNDHFKEKAWLYYQAPHQGDFAYLNYFDRGYGGLYFKDYSKECWEEIFTKAGYEVEQCVNARDRQIMQIWNIGTRPIASPIMVMAEQLKTEERKKVKEFWVDFFYDFFRPVLKKTFEEKNREEDCAYCFYVIQKR